MNYNAEIGSKWNGRILMKCVVSDVDSPIARVSDIPENIVNEAMSLSRQVKWKVWVRIISAMYLPEESAEYSVRVSIQEKLGRPNLEQLLMELLILKKTIIKIFY